MSTRISRRALVPLTAALTGVGIASSAAVRHQPEPFELPETDLTWLFAGDSITQGAHDTKGARNYCEHLTEYIRFDLWRTSDIVINSAVSGWRVENLATDLDRHVLQWRPDVLLLMIGTNHARDGETGIDPFRDGVINVLDRLDPATRVIVQTPPVFDPMIYPEPHAVFPEYVEVIRTIARDRGLPLIDHFAVWGDLPNALTDLLADGLHPNAPGHRLIADTIIGTLGI